MSIDKENLETDSELIEQLRQCSVATVHEVLGKIGALDGAIKPLDRSMKVCGRAFTVQCPSADNLMLIKAVSIAKPGDVIVADTGDCLNAGPFGEVLAVDAMSRQIAGLVTSGSVRDSEAIIRRGFPVYAKGISVRGTAKASLGTINHPISIGGIIVNPGDYILGDADGVVVIPQDRAAEAVVKANEREQKEAAIMERLMQGEKLFDIYGYQSVLDQLGYLE